MQEEVEQRTVTLIVNCSKLTAREFEKAISKLYAQMKSKDNQPEVKHGKMSVKELAAQNKGMQSIEVTEDSIGSFSRIAQKYGIDFAPFKVKGENRYLVFFKGPDTDAMTAAFKEYTEKEMKHIKRPSILEKLKRIKERMGIVTPSREKHKELER